jgi:hypothetical protein
MARGFVPLLRPTFAVLFCLALIAPVTPAAAEDDYFGPAVANPCAHAQTEAADELADHLTDWASVETMFKKFDKCDVGEIYESNSEGIAHLLTNQWPTLPHLMALIQADPPFRAFVLRHIDATLDTAELDRIADLASGSCPPDAADLCTVINDAATHAAQ